MVGPSHFKVLVCVAGLLCAVGCARVDVQADSEMQGGVEIASHEGIAFHLASFDSGGDEPGEALELEQALETCLQREVVRARPTVKFIAAKSVRAALPASVPSKAPDPQAFLSQYKNTPAALERPAYLVLLDAVARVGEPKWDVVSGLGFGVGRERDVALYVTATILDVARDKVLGDVTAIAQGRRGGFFGMFLFIVPIGGHSDVQFDEELCAELGRALSQRINTR